MILQLHKVGDKIQINEEVSFLNNNIIEMKNIIKSFYIGTPNQLNILKNIDITVKEGEFVSIIGTSGSGKSTLMNIIGALDRPTSGNIY